MLHKQFIDEALKLHADVLVDDQAAVSVYTLINRISVVLSSAVIEKVERSFILIIDTYLTPTKPSPIS